MLIIPQCLELVDFKNYIPPCFRFFMEHDSYTDDEIRDILSLKHVAVIGMSKNDNKAAHYVPKYLSENGYHIIPVNPTTDEILGKNVTILFLTLMVILTSLMCLGHLNLSFLL